MPALADLRFSPVALELCRSTPCRSTMDALCAETLARCESFGLLRSVRMPKRKYLAIRFELLTSLFFPDASFEELALMNDFMTYFFFVDDQAEEDEAYGKHPDRLRRYFESHLAILRGDGARLDDPAGRLLVDLRDRLRPRASERWFARLRSDLEDYLLRGTLSAAKHWTHGTVPAIEAYSDQRAFDCAAQCTQTLLEVAGAGELPEQVVAASLFQELRRLCTNVIGYTNDLVSYPKEVRQYQSPNNLVHVVMVHEGLSLEGALSRVIELINQDLQRFEQRAAALPTFSRDLEQRVARYVRGQRCSMVGNLLWSICTGRYVDADSPFPELRAAPGDSFPTLPRELASLCAVA